MVDMLHKVRDKLFAPADDVIQDSVEGANPDRQQGQHGNRWDATNNAKFSRACDEAAFATHSEPSQDHKHKVVAWLQKDPSLAKDIWPVFRELLHSKEPTRRWLAIDCLHHVLREAQPDLPESDLQGIHNAAKTMANAPVDQERTNDLGMKSTERSQEARHAAEALLADEAMWNNLKQVPGSGSGAGQAAVPNSTAGIQGATADGTLPGNSSKPTDIGAPVDGAGTVDGKAGEGTSMQSGSDAPGPRPLDSGFRQGTL